MENPSVIDAGNITGSLSGGTSGWIDGHSASIAIQGTDLVLTVVPEPGTLAMLLAGIAIGACIRWKKRRHPNSRI